MTATTANPSTSAPALSRLYAARFAFALVWAAVILIAASEINPFIGTLLVLYPVYDLVATAADARLSGSSTPRSALLVNAVVSGTAAVALGFAASSGIPAVLRAWGAWAIVAGIAQLVVALRRRSLGGQVPMIVSGAISVLAGGSFAATASQDDPSLSALGGYALLGALFFLVSSILLRRGQQKS